MSDGQRAPIHLPLYALVVEFLAAFPPRPGFLWYFLGTLRPYTRKAEGAVPATAGGPLACPHRPPCTGCPRFGETGIAATAAAGLDELARLHGLPAVDVVSGSREGFRLRARLAIRGRLGSPKLGLFEAGTHRVVHVPNCRIQHPLINRVAGVVRRALVDAEMTSYSDGAHAGLARYLQVVVERSSQSAQVVLVGNSPSAQPFARCLDLIRDRLGSELHSLWFNANCGTSNTILGPDFELWSGPRSIVERFGGPAIHYPPGAFGQSNLEVAERIIEHLRAAVPAGASVTEFYAGVGAIGLSIVAGTGTLRLNEVSPHSLAGLDMGIAGLDAVERARVTIMPGPAGVACLATDPAQIVIADPPRKGLDPELTARLRTAPPQRLLYVSCGLESLREDAATLTSGGTLRLAALTAFDLMPFTAHVETVARFERTGSLQS